MSLHDDARFQEIYQDALRALEYLPHLESYPTERARIAERFTSEFLARHPEAPTVSEPTAEQVLTIAEGLRKRFAVSNGTQVWVEFQGSAEALADEIADIFAQLQVQAPVGEPLENEGYPTVMDMVRAANSKSEPATLQTGIANASDGEREALLDFLTNLPGGVTDEGQEIPLLHLLPTWAREYLRDALLHHGYRRSPVVDVEDVARVLHQALGIENEYAPTPDDRVESCYPSFYDCVGQHARDESFVPGDAMCFHTATAILAHLLEGGA